MADRYQTEPHTSGIRAIVDSHAGREAVAYAPFRHAETVRLALELLAETNASLAARHAAGEPVPRSAAPETAVNPAMPAVEDAIEVLRHWQDPMVTLAGKEWVSWWNLASALFRKGHPAWKRPEGKPHGLNDAPVTVFMSGLPNASAGRIERLIYRGSAYFRLVGVP